MRLEVNRNRMIMFIINLFILCGFFIFMRANWNASVSGTQWCTEIMNISLVLLVYQIIVLCFEKYRYVDFIPWFVVLSWIFLYGRIIVRALGYDDQITWHLFSAFDEQTMYRAALFCLVYTQALFTGLTAVAANNDLVQDIRLEERKEEEDSYYTSDRMAFIGWGFFVLTLPVKVYCNISTIVASRVSQGYVISGDYNGFILALSYLFTGSLILLLCSKKYSKRAVHTFFLVFMLYELAYMIFSGDRRQEVIGIIALALCYCKIYDVKLNLRKVLLVIAAGFVGLVVLAAIRSGRRDVITSFSQFGDLVSEIMGSNILIETLGEFGGTFFTVVSAVAFYPSQYSYATGLTYLAGFLIIVPGLFTSLFPNVFAYGSVSAACKRITGLALGGSLAMDMYANFGSFGAIITIIMGIIIARGLRSSNVEQVSRYSIAKYYILFFVVLNGVRAGFYELTRPIAYTFILIKVLDCVYNLLGMRNGTEAQDEGQYNVE